MKIYLITYEAWYEINDVIYKTIETDLFSAHNITEAFYNVADFCLKKKYTLNYIVQVYCDNF